LNDDLPQTEVDGIEIDLTTSGPLQGEHAKGLRGRQMMMLAKQKEMKEDTYENVCGLIIVL